ncbi:hypothetical protein [Streptomyces sp. NPDC127038]|uniref:hypothetical protein n=1 Tax=Streptomyces sp. NPDC127038 TaxID=3347114 RepID=UPI00365E0ED7
MSTIDLIGRIRAATPGEVVGMLYDARDLLRTAEWEDAVQAALTAGPHDRTNPYDDNAAMMWTAVEALVEDAVDNIAEYVADDNDVAEVALWRSVCQPDPYSSIRTVPVQQLVTWENVRDAIKDAALPAVRLAIAHAAGGGAVKEFITPEQYATLTAFVPGGREPSEP